MLAERLTRAQKLTGTNEPANKTRALSTGGITATLDDGALRSIRFHGIETVRGIAFLSRNTSWGTYAATISKLKVRQNQKQFSVTYTAVCKDDTQELHYDVEIVGEAAGRLVFRAKGHPRTDYVTNRTGFVVLHPLGGVSGKPLQVVHTDGKLERTRFTKLISPGQPVFWIRSMAHQVMPGVTATVTMEGDAFEMEDHRNWMDASYKTYVHSLLDKWPYTLAKDQPFEQCVTVDFKGAPKRPATRSNTGIVVEIGKAGGRMPRIGTAVSMQHVKDALAVSQLAGTTRFASFVCQLDGRNPNLLDVAKSYAALSRQTQTPIKLELILPAKVDASVEIAELATVVRSAGLHPQSIVVTHAHDLQSFQPQQARPWGPSYEDMAAAARKVFPKALIGGGMLTNFTELNRKPIPKGVFDFVIHALCPIVHAADDLSVMETLEALPWIFASTRAMVGRTPYHLGPSSISARSNPYGPGLSTNPDNKRMCLAGNDPRERGLFAAAWSLGVAASAAQHGIAEIALNAFAGPNGLINDDASLTPNFHLVTGLTTLQNSRVCRTTCSMPNTVCALATESKGNRTVWLANLTAESQDISVKALNGPVEMHHIDEFTFAKLQKSPDYLRANGERLRSVKKLALPAYGLVRLASV
jgi:D-apionolactonase